MFKGVFAAHQDASTDIFAFLKAVDPRDIIGPRFTFVKKFKNLIQVLRFDGFLTDIGSLYILEFKFCLKNYTRKPHSANSSPEFGRILCARADDYITGFN